MEKKITMEQGVGENRQLIPSRVEVKFPEYDWKIIWPRIRLRGLSLSSQHSYLRFCMTYYQPKRELQGQVLVKMTCVSSA